MLPFLLGNFGFRQVAVLVLVIGGEAQGVSRIARQKADVMVHLPMPGHTESLNAGVTCSVMLYEALRRRLALSCYDPLR